MTKLFDLTSAVCCLPQFFKISHKYKTQQKIGISTGTWMQLNGIPSLLQETTGSCNLWMMCLSFIAALERSCCSGSDSFSVSTCLQCLSPCGSSPLPSHLYLHIFFTWWLHHIISQCLDCHYCYEWELGVVCVASAAVSNLIVHEFGNWEAYFSSLTPPMFFASVFLWEIEMWCHQHYDGMSQRCRVTFLLDTVMSFPWHLCRAPSECWALIPRTGQQTDRLWRIPPHTPVPTPTHHVSTHTHTHTHHVPTHAKSTRATWHTQASLIATMYLCTCT